MFFVCAREVLEESVWNYLTTLPYLKCLRIGSVMFSSLMVLSPCHLATYARSNLWHHACRENLKEIWNRTLQICDSADSAGRLPHALDDTQCFNVSLQFFIKNPTSSKCIVTPCFENHCCNHQGRSPQQANTTKG